MGKTPLSETLVTLERRAAGELQGALALLHGRGTSEQNLYPLLDLLDPDRRLLGLTVRGPLMLPPGGYHWYRLGGIPTPEPSTFSQSVALLGETLDAIPVTMDRVVLGGFSQGAVMSFALSLGPGRPRPAAILGLSGFLPRVDSYPLSLSQLDGLRVALAHGTEDDVIPFRYGQEACDRLIAAGADVLWLPTRVGHSLDQRIVPELVSFIAEVTSQAAPPAGYDAAD